VVLPWYPYATYRTVSHAASSARNVASSSARDAPNPVTSTVTSIAVAPRTGTMYASQYPSARGARSSSACAGATRAVTASASSACVLDSTRQEASTSGTKTSKRPSVAL
jgi:hypothetical protein